MKADYWSTTYCAYTWIYFTKKANWKTEAIVGAMSYMLAEGLGGLGCGTYESYWCVGGPCGHPNCKLLDNQAWRSWINNYASTIMRATGPYAGRGDIYSAFGIGLLADSNVWSAPNVLLYTTANQFLDAAIQQKKYWQDPTFQIPYYLTHVFTMDTVWDTPGCNPVTDNRSPEEWCQRLTAGYGMPAWTWNSGHPLIQAHVDKMEYAWQIFNSYPSNFTPEGVETFKPRLTQEGISTSIYWGEQNPLTLGGFGLPNCTCYAWGRFWEIGDPEGTGENRPNLPTGNGQDWFPNPNGYKTSQTPQLGAVACFSKPNGLGHVSIVEKILPNKDIVTSNSAYGGQYFFTMTLPASQNYYDAWSGLYCQGFILNPHANQNGGWQDYSTSGCLALNLINGFVVGVTDTDLPAAPPEQPKPGENKSPLLFPPELFKQEKSIIWQFTKWVWKDISEKPDNIIIEGLHRNEDGYMCDKNDYLCLVCPNGYEKGYLTPFGKDGYVYETYDEKKTGIKDTIFVYTDWENNFKGGNV